MPLLRETHQPTAPKHADQPRHRRRVAGHVMVGEAFATLHCTSGGDIRARRYRSRSFNHCDWVASVRRGCYAPVDAVGASDAAETDPRRRHHRLRCGTPGKRQTKTDGFGVMSATDQPSRQGSKRCLIVYSPDRQRLNSPKPISPRFQKHTSRRTGPPLRGRCTFSKRQGSRLHGERSEGNSSTSTRDEIASGVGGHATRSPALYASRRGPRRTADEPRRRSARKGRERWFADSPANGWTRPSRSYGSGRDGPRPIRYLGAVGGIDPVLRDGRVLHRQQTPRSSMRRDS